MAVKLETLHRVRREMLKDAGAASAPAIARETQRALDAFTRADRSWLVHKLNGLDRRGAVRGDGKLQDAEAKHAAGKSPLRMQMLALAKRDEEDLAPVRAILDRAAAIAARPETHPFAASWHGAWGGGDMPPYVRFAPSGEQAIAVAQNALRTYRDLASTPATAARLAKAGIGPETLALAAFTAMETTAQFTRDQDAIYGAGMLGMGVFDHRLAQDLTRDAAFEAYSTSRFLAEAFRGGSGAAILHDLAKVEHTSPAWEPLMSILLGTDIKRAMAMMGPGSGMRLGTPAA